jgi:hypothetical protein
MSWTCNSQAGITKSKSGLRIPATVIYSYYDEIQKGRINIFKGKNEEKEILHDEDSPHRMSRFHCGDNLARR